MASSALLVSGTATQIGLDQALWGYAGLSLPLDLAGGQILPYVWKQPKLSLSRWTTLYLRALLLHLVLLASGLTLACLAFRFAGPGLAAALYAALALLLLRFQLSTLRWLGISLDEQPGFSRVHSFDHRFTGGLAGFPWPGCEQPVMPAHWLGPQAPEGFEAHLARRQRLSASGARAAGAFLGIVFNALGLWLVLGWAGGHPATLACAFTLWSFLGLLLLPSLSRPGVFAADAISSQTLGVERARVWLGWLESQQEEDAVRPAWTERIFHPIPQWSRRRLLDSPLRSWIPWNAARYALVTSALAGGLLSRAVHCNCGRPELWFWPPND
jgi:hypothetical protein